MSLRPTLCISSDFGGEFMLLYLVWFLFSDLINVVSSMADSFFWSAILVLIIFFMIAFLFCGSTPQEFWFGYFRIVICLACLLWLSWRYRFLTRVWLRIFGCACYLKAVFLVMVWYNLFYFNLVLLMLGALWVMSVMLDNHVQLECHPSHNV